MKSFGCYLLRVFVVTLVIGATKAVDEAVSEANIASTIKLNEQPTAGELTQPSENQHTKEIEANEARGLASGYEVIEHTDGLDDGTVAFSKHDKPLQNTFMGFYKNYKSTYLGNKTSLEYKQRLRDRVTLAVALAEAKAKDEAKLKQVEVNDDAELIENIDKKEDFVQAENFGELARQRIRDRLELAAALAKRQQQAAEEPSDDGISIDEEDIASYTVEADIDVNAASDDEEVASSNAHKKRRKRKRKNRNNTKTAKTQNNIKTPTTVATEEESLGSSHSDSSYRYDIGSGVNVSLDMNNDIVSIKLDGNNLLELAAGRWLSDNSEEGRGKKYEMVTKVLPLFILPFLIQSAIVPFLVTKLKLLLVKSILVGKLAIFLLIISAIKNSNKPMQTYEVAPSYWAGEPSRRSEVAAAASSMAYNGYRVEGKPAAWIN